MIFLTILTSACLQTTECKNIPQVDELLKHHVLDHNDYSKFFKYHLCYKNTLINVTSKSTSESKIFRALKALRFIPNLDGKKLLLAIKKNNVLRETRDLNEILITILQNDKSIEGENFLYKFIQDPSNPHYRSAIKALLYRQSKNFDNIILNRETTVGNIVIKNRLFSIVAKKMSTNFYTNENIPKKYLAIIGAFFKHNVPIFPILVNHNSQAYVFVDNKWYLKENLSHLRNFNYYFFDFKTALHSGNFILLTVKTLDFHIECLLKKEGNNWQLLQNVQTITY